MISPSTVTYSPRTARITVAQAAAGEPVTPPRTRPAVRRPPTACHATACSASDVSRRRRPHRPPGRRAGLDGPRYAAYAAASQPAGRPAGDAAARSTTATATSSRSGTARRRDPDDFQITDPPAKRTSWHRSCTSRAQSSARLLGEQNGYVVLAKEQPTATENRSTTSPSPHHLSGRHPAGLSRGQLFEPLIGGVNAADAGDATSSTR